MNHNAQLLQGAEENADESCSFVTAAWFGAAAIGAVALGVFVGREIRTRYKFKRRTPYDYYAHAGDGREELAGLSEFGYGV